MLSGTSEDWSAILEEMILCNQDEGLRICEHVLDYTAEAKGNSGESQPDSPAPSHSHAKDVLGGCLNEEAQDSPVIDGNDRKSIAIHALVQTISEFEDLLIKTIEGEKRER